ncbi:MAG: DUF3109 family protein [Bacteroidetes bacterium]|nr:DUF3109 family protein [Bacteroidota bacterium]
MIEIDNTLVSDDILERKFVCDLNACKGECCVAGDSGAPLEKEEAEILAKIYPTVKPFMNAEGIAEIEKMGVSLIDSDGDLVTPLVDGVKHCAFVIFENSIAKCSIEKAFYAGKVDFKKPISCHLYPVRITKYKHFEAVNYEEWDVCKPACNCGEKLDVPVYKFLKEPLVRKFGNDWYAQLELLAKEHKSKAV